MSRKHHCKHGRTPGGYKRRLQDRGLSRSPRMKYTGMTTEQILREFRREDSLRDKQRALARR
jgi:hypothetical protein